MEQKPTLLNQVRDAVRLKHYAYRTEQSYVDWARRYILFHNKSHPNDMGEKEVQEFLINLALEKNVASSTQNQALSAILFLYRYVLKIELAQNTLIFSRLKKEKIRPNCTFKERSKSSYSTNGRSLSADHATYVWQRLGPHGSLTSTRQRPRFC